MTRLLNVLLHPVRVFNVWLDAKPIEPTDPLVARCLADEARLRKAQSSNALAA